MAVSFALSIPRPMRTINRTRSQRNLVGADFNGFLAEAKPTSTPVIRDVAFVLFRLFSIASFEGKIVGLFEVAEPLAGGECFEYLLLAGAGTSTCAVSTNV